jgi:putative hydrolase of the HAD superfamily
MKIREPQHLIFDADDTLWENNVYFDDAFDRFCEFLNHSHLTPDQIRAALDEIEIVNNKIHGYGAKNFARNLAQCYRHLCERGIGDEGVQRVMGFADEILRAPMELIAGVEETLAKLGEVHELTLFTKGQAEEQHSKIERSGLRSYFDHCEVVKEKNAAAYRALVDQQEFNLNRAWMIGNSPKSDINPALRAGMRAVFIPHARTWTLEREEMPSKHERLVCLTSFSELTRVFL